MKFFAATAVTTTTIARPRQHITVHNRLNEVVRITVIENSSKPDFHFFSKNWFFNCLKFFTNHWDWIDLTVPANRAYQTGELRNTEKSCFDAAFNVIFCPQVWFFTGKIDNLAWLCMKTDNSIETRMKQGFLWSSLFLQSPPIWLLIFDLKMVSKIFWH